MKLYPIVLSLCLCFTATAFAGQPLLSPDLVGELDASGGNIKLPQGITCATNDCDEADEAGRVCVDTDATTGEQFYLCEGLAGWILQSSGGGTVDSVNGATGVVVLDQDDIASGTTNKAYTVTEQSKLSGIAAGAEVNVQSDWNASGTDAEILNKPTLGTAAAAATGDFAPALGVDDNYVTDAEKTVIGLTSGTNTGDQTLTGLDYEPTGTAASTMSTHTTTHPAPTTRDTRNQIVMGADDNYVTDAEKTVIGNTSGTNTGDQTNITGNAGTVTNGVYTTDAGTVFLAPTGDGSGLSGVVTSEVDPTVDSSAEIQAIIGAGIYEPADATILKDADIGTSIQAYSVNMDTDSTDDATAGGAFHDGFSDFVANEHINWTADQGVTDIHSGNIPDLSGAYESADATILKQADVDDEPVDAATTDPISSNWAYDHGAAADPHTGYVLESAYCPGITTNTKSANYTIGTDESCECYGGAVYVTSAAIITACDGLTDGMEFEVHTIGAIEVSLDVQADDKMYLDGALLDDGDKATNNSTTGDLIKCTYFSVDGWYCSSGSLGGIGVWTDGG